MLYVHFNGEVVRGADMIEVARRTAERRIEQCKCCYGKNMLLCTAYRSYTGRKYIYSPKRKLCPCKLSKNKNLCPMYCERIERGNIKKTYRMDWRTYRRLSSAAHYLIKTGKYKTVFLTLTFSKWRSEHKLTKSFYYDEITNQLFSKFAENLRKNYGCCGYIAVKEYGEIGNRVHFHFCASLPFIDFTILNRVWCRTIQDICLFSECAVRTDPKHDKIIRSPARAIRYVCKYFSKGFGRESATKLYFISNNLLIDPVKIQEPDEQSYKETLKGYDLKVRSYEYVTIFRVAKRKDFYRFCRDFLYPAFMKLSEKCNVMNELCQFVTEKSQNST